MMVLARYDCVVHGSSMSISSSCVPDSSLATTGVIVGEPAPAGPADTLRHSCRIAGPVSVSCSMDTDFVVVAVACGCASHFGFIRLCCSRIPSRRHQHPALCVAPTARTHRSSGYSHQASVAHQLFWVAATCTFSWNVSSGLTLWSIVIGRPIWRSKGGSAPPGGDRTPWLGIERAANKLVNILPLWNLHTPCSWPHKVLVGVHCLAQPDQLKPIHFELATQEPRS